MTYPSLGVAEKIAADVVRLIAGRASVSSGAVRVGIDVVSVADFARVVQTRGGVALVSTRFSTAEVSYCKGRPDRLAVRWAAKEAVAKAIGTGFRGLRPIDIEVVHGSHGQPSAVRVGQASWPERAHEWAWSLTLCHEGDAAVAIAVAVVPRDTCPAPIGQTTEKEGSADDR